MNRFVSYIQRSILIFALGIAVTAPALAQDNSYPWMKDRSGEWTIVDDAGQDICVVTLKPVPEFTLDDGAGNIDASACPAPYNEVKKWRMPDPDYLYFQKGWSTPFQGKDPDGDGVFEGRFGKKRDNLNVTLVQTTGAAAGRASIVPVQAAAPVEEVPPIFHLSSLMDGQWRIENGMGQTVCKMFMHSRKPSQTKDTSGGKYNITRDPSCVAPFDNISLWEAPDHNDVFIFNNSFSRAKYRASDKDGDGTYEGLVGEAYFRMIPDTPDRVRKYQALSNPGHGAWDASTRRPGPKSRIGTYEFREAGVYELEYDCQIDLEFEPQRRQMGVIPNPNQTAQQPDEGIVRVDGNCPDRIRRSTHWSFRPGVGFVLSANDGTALRGVEIESYPKTLELKRFEGPDLDIPHPREWHLIKITGKGSVDVFGNERPIAQVTAPTVLGEWLLNNADVSDCVIELQPNGRIPRTFCGGFYAFWRVENGRLIILSNTQTPLFEGVISSTGRISNIDDPRETLVRPER